MNTSSPWYQKLLDLSKSASLVQPNRRIQLVLAAEESAGPDLWGAGRIMMALHDAAGLIGQSMTEEKESPRRTAPSRARASLQPIAMAGDRIIVGFPQDKHEEGMIVGLDGGRSLGEAAVRSLLNVLPKSHDTDDIRTFDIAQQSAALRSAVSEMADVVVKSSVVWNLQLNDPEHDEADDGQSRAAVLTPTQAKNIQTNLLRERTKSTVVPMTGTLDGVRTSRHVFYLIASGGKEISGAVDESMIMKMKDFINQRVAVNVERTTINSLDGKRPRHAYKLMSIQPIQPDTTLFDQPDE